MRPHTSVHRTTSIEKKKLWLAAYMYTFGNAEFGRTNYIATTWRPWSRGALIGIIPRCFVFEDHAVVSRALSGSGGVTGERGPWTMRLLVTERGVLD